MIAVRAPGARAHASRCASREPRGCDQAEEARVRYSPAQTSCLSCSGCLVLDGFPRSVYQANWLEHFLGTRSGNKHDLLQNAPLAIQIIVDREEVMRRLSGRRSCPSCGRSYNLDFQPPINSGICDYDDTKLVMRPDDSESVIRERLMVHDRNALPLAESYRCKGRLLEVDGNTTVDAVRNAIAVELEPYFAF